MAATRNPTAVWINRRNGKRGTSYRLRWIDPKTGKMASEACGRDLAYARVRRDQVKQELRDGLSGRLPDTSLADLRDRLADLMAGRSPHTIAKTKDSLNCLETLCGAMPIASIDRGVIMDFRAKRLAKGLSPATVNKDLRRSFSTLAQRAGVDRHVVKDLGGWSTVGVVEKHYTGDVSPVYRAAMDRIAGVKTA